jgi:hypothetical protein
MLRSRSHPRHSKNDWPNRRRVLKKRHRAEIGDRLRMLLSKEQPRLPSRIQHLLDRLSRLDATISK